MGALVTTLYLVAALINLAPVSGVFGAARLEALYGLPFADPNLLVLMRHRAVLFGIVGVLLAVAAFVPGISTIAAVARLLSLGARAISRRDCAGFLRDDLDQPSAGPWVS